MVELVSPAPEEPCLLGMHLRGVLQVFQEERLHLPRGLRILEHQRALLEQVEGQRVVVRRR
jgi:hypothetical protein